MNNLPGIFKSDFFSKLKFSSNWKINLPQFSKALPKSTVILPKMFQTDNTSSSAPPPSAQPVLHPSNFIDFDGKRNIQNNTNEININTINNNNNNPNNVPANESNEYTKFIHLTPEGAPSNQRTFDCCAFVIYCPAHDKIALFKPKDKRVAWVPFTVLPNNRSWNEGCLYGSYVVLAGGQPEKLLALKDNPPYFEAQLIEVFRFQLPQSIDFITRLTYFIRLNPRTTNKNFACCQNTNRIQWTPLEIINSGVVDNIWGPEIFDFSRWASSPYHQKIHEYGLDRALYYVPRDPPRNLEEAMLKTTGITAKDVERLYSDFIDHCFPSFYMTIWSFKVYMLKYGFEQADLKLIRLFNAFNFNKNGFLSFHELLLGLASIEPNTLHGEARAKFIFRYYDIKNKGVLHESDFKRIVRDINPRDSDDDIEIKSKEAMKVFVFKEIAGKNAITYEEFYKKVGAHKFRGTSGLCRSIKPIFAHISKSMADKMLETIAKEPKGALKTIVKRRNYTGVCHRCKEKEYLLCPYSVKLNFNYLLSEPKPLYPFANMRIVKAEPYFNAESAAAILTKLIREFNQHKGNIRNPKGLLSENKDTFMELFQSLYVEIMNIFKNENRCPTVSSPVFIIGDIHGNIEDLLSLETVIWKRMPIFGAKLLFLGDYVDRGKWSVECALYVLSMKVLMPNRITLLRGNHEIREIQAKYSFKRECYFKYGDKLGERVWEMFNRIFDRMPISAVVDDAIFCSHGGIPFSATTIKEINSNPLDIKFPERDSIIWWEIMWSDPIQDQQFIEVCELFQLDPSKTRGFVRNTKRGTAYFFNEVGADFFFSTNGLTHMIRAHEVPATGFTFHFGDKCLTIFSCSHYCGNNNECAVIYADQEVLRIIRVDTVNNAPATD